MVAPIAYIGAGLLLIISTPEVTMLAIPFDGFDTPNSVGDESFQDNGNPVYQLRNSNQQGSSLGVGSRQNNGYPTAYEQVPRTASLPVAQLSSTLRNTDSNVAGETIRDQQLAVHPWSVDRSPLSNPQIITSSSQSSHPISPSRIINIDDTDSTTNTSTPILQSAFPTTSIRTPASDHSTSNGLRMNAVSETQSPSVSRAPSSDPKSHPPNLVAGKNQAPDFGFVNHQNIDGQRRKTTYRTDEAGNIVESSEVVV